MTIYDAAMIGLVLLGMIWGAIRGITWQLASIASLILGYLVAFPLSGQLAPHFPGEPVVARSMALLVSYVAVSASVFLAAWVVRATLRQWQFEAYDRHLGMILGSLEGAIVGLVITLFVLGLSPRSRTPILTSSSGQVVCRVLATIEPVLPSEIRAELSKFWNKVGTTATSDQASLQVDSGARLPTLKQAQAKALDDGASVLQNLIEEGESRFGRAITEAADKQLYGKTQVMTETLSVGDRAINLTQVLKRAGWASNGGQAKAMIAEGHILVNGEVEIRKRRQMAIGDRIESDQGASLILV